jgi:hypothetical protein
MNICAWICVHMVIHLWQRTCSGKCVSLWAGDKLIGAITCYMCVRKCMDIYIYICMYVCMFVRRCIRGIFMYPCMHRCGSPPCRIHFLIFKSPGVASFPLGLVSQKTQVENPFGNYGGNILLWETKTSGNSWCVECVALKRQMDPTGDVQIFTT